MKYKRRLHPIVHAAVDISDREKCTRELEEMVEVLKGAVAMDLCVSKHGWCVYFSVSLYCPCEATWRGTRNRLFAIAMSEQSRTRTTGNSVWLGIDRYAALFKHGTTRDFGFSFSEGDMTLHTFVRNLGSSIAQNANSVECLRLEAGSEGVFFKKWFSLDVWKEAFPSLQRAYFIGNISALVSASPHLIKHVRGLEHLCRWHAGKLPRQYLDWIGNMIRNNVIEEVGFLSDLLDDGKLLDDTLRRVRSFEVKIQNSTSMDHLARSFERTKAEGDKLERVSLGDSSFESNSLRATAVETILQSRPNLKVLNVTMSSPHDFVGVCQAVASSTLTTFKCDCRDMSSTRGEAAFAMVGELLQHSTIRDLQLLIDNSFDDYCDYNDFVQGIAEGLRATRLRRFQLTLVFGPGVSIASMTKLYESVRENRSLMDIQLEGDFWDPWREPMRHDLPHAPPCPFSFFEFLSSRNQYLSQLLMTYESTLPAGLWPLILESASSDASILYFLLSFQPHIVKGTVEGTVAADREWNVDGPTRK